MSAEKKLEEMNAKCKECQEAFIKDGFEFKASYCKYCAVGTEIHQLSVLTSPAEQKWDGLNWTSSKNEDLYHG